MSMLHGPDPTGMQLLLLPSYTVAACPEGLLVPPDDHGHTPVAMYRA
jgi:hypothetical protein